MFDALTKLFEGKNINTYKLEDDSEKPTEECKDPKCKDHPVLLYNGIADQGTAGSSR